MSRSSQSAMGNSPDHPPPARITYPTHGRRSFFFPNYCSLDSSRRDGLEAAFGYGRDQKSIEFVRQTFSHTPSCHRPFCRARCASGNNILSHSPLLVGQVTLNCCSFLQLSNSTLCDRSVFSSGACGFCVILLTSQFGSFRKCVKTAPFVLESLALCVPITLCLFVLSVRNSKPVG